MMTCIHRGHIVRTSNEAGRLVKVYQCGLHGECTHATIAESLKHCKGCDDREAGSVECVHRGDELRRLPCIGCKGQITVKVFGCAIFGECTQGDNTAGLQKCSTACPQLNVKKGCDDQVTDVRR